jgi:hypothetical protein
LPPPALHDGCQASRLTRERSPIHTHRSADESFARLHAAGCSVGETGSAGGWLVTGANGENVRHVTA